MQSLCESVKESESELERLRHEVRELEAGAPSGANPRKKAW